MALDERVHLAVKYDPAEMKGPDGEAMRGPSLRGMSGGGLFLVVGSETQTGIEVTLLLAGILTTCRGEPHNALIATRVDCLLDAISPTRPEERRTHSGMDVVRPADA